MADDQNHRSVCANQSVQTEPKQNKKEKTHKASNNGSVRFFMIDLKPTVCNLCGGEVHFVDNNIIYGRKYGSGKAYLCTQCGAYVGTHKPRPEEALGLLSDERMRKGRGYCHALFDKMWLNAEPGRKRKRARTKAYRWLAKKMDIPVEMCHFGYFDLQQLRKAYVILRDEAQRREQKSIAPTA